MNANDIKDLRDVKEEVHGLKLSVDDIKNTVIELCSIEIIVKNGEEKHIKYRRNEFFQMLFDRKNVWKEKVRITAKDIILFIGVITLIVDNIFGIF